MANEGRYLNRNLIAGEGFLANPSSALVRDGDNAWNHVGGIRVEDGIGVAALIGVLASINFSAIQPAGSSGAQAVDVVLTGVQPGDLCWAAPVQSVPDGIVWGAACYSAGVVNVRVLHTLSGNLDLAATDWRIVALRFK